MQNCENTSEGKNSLGSLLNERNGNMEQHGKAGWKVSGTALLLSLRFPRLEVMPSQGNPLAVA